MNISPIELQAHQRLAETGLSAAELLSMDMSEYARVTGRPTVGQLAAQVFDFEPPGIARQDAPDASQTAAQPPAAAPLAIELSGISMDDYAALRGQLGMGISHQEGRGLLNQSGTQSWAAAARAKSGRAAMNSRNVVESPRITRPFLNPDEHRDTRTVAERFSQPGNFFGA